MNIQILNTIFQGYLGTMTMTTSQKKREIQVHSYCYNIIWDQRYMNIEMPVDEYKIRLQMGT